jgi:predicted small lipoprotein YifL
MNVTRAFVVTMAIATAVSGCGRKTGLDTPYEAAVQARKDAEKAKEPLPPVPEKPVADRPFILDRLIN